MNRPLHEDQTQPCHVCGVARVRADPNAQRHWRELGDALGVYCTVPGCDRAHHRGGMCAMHAMQVQTKRARSAA